MKNIHILPTDKPSRIHLIKDNLTITNEYKNSVCDSEVHIYITSDEEINKDTKTCWCIDISYNELILHQGLLPSYHYKHYKKIIMTTDKSINVLCSCGKDCGAKESGVQPIDDEFLEWFVKNPTCEEVEVIKVCSTGRKCDGKGKNCNMAKLKIIIPKEEQKQDYSGVHLRHCYQGEYEDGCKYGEDDCPAKPLEKPKKLTDLEIAIKLEEIEREEFQQETLEKGLMEIELNHTKILVYSCERALEERNEQIKRMYSEGEVLQLLLRLQQTESYDNLYDWFEKYKKK
jgi:hypothetical protein